MSELGDGRDADEVVASLGKRQFLLTDVRDKQQARAFSSRWAMSYLRGPVTLAEMGPLLRRPDGATGASSDRPEPFADREGRSHAPPLAASVAVAYAADGDGPAAPSLLVRNRLTVQRTTLDLYREIEEVWKIPVREDGRLDWEEADPLGEVPEIADEPPAGMVFPDAAPGSLSDELDGAEGDFATWRARRPIELMVNEKLKMVAEEGEDEDAFLERCLEAADRADDAAQERMRKTFESRVRTLKKRLARERDELERDRGQLQSRKAEETMGMVEGLLSVLLGSKSIRTASSKAASKLRTAAGKRRMRQTAKASVVESENEIERLEAEIVALGDELQDEIDRIAAESEEKAEQIEQNAVKAKKSDIAVLDLWLLWG